MVKKLLCLSLLLVSVQIQALEQGEWNFDLNVASKHSEESYGSGDYNEENWGLGASYGYWDNLDLKFGFFENSYDKTSVYAGAFYHKDFYFGDWTVAPGVGLLLATGYDDTPENAPVVAPILMPAITFGHRAVKANVGLIPFGQVKAATLQLQFNFDHF